MDCDSFARDVYGFSAHKMSDEFVSAPTVNLSYYGSNTNPQQDASSLRHDTCYPCDSPDCGEEAACTGIQVECYDPICLEDATQLCDDAYCAGPLAPIDLNGAQVLLQLSEHNMAMAGGVGCSFAGHLGPPTYGGATTTMGIQNARYSNEFCGHASNYNNMCYGNVTTDCNFYNHEAQICNYSMVDISCNHNPNQLYTGHDNASYNNSVPNLCLDPLACPLEAEFPYPDFSDQFYACQHFGYIDNPTDYHNWQHHRQQNGVNLCNSMSATQHAVLDMPDSLPRSYSDGSDETTTRNSSNTTPHRSRRHYTSTPLTSGHGSPEPDHVVDPEAPYYCKWFIGGADHNLSTTCNEKFMTAKALQEHVEEKHCNVLSKAKDGFFCRWEGCDRLALPKNKAFAQKSKLERHVQKHTGCKFCNLAERLHSSFSRLLFSKCRY